MPKITLKFENHIKGSRISKKEFDLYFKKGLKILEREKRLNKALKMRSKKNKIAPRIDLTIVDDLAIKKLNKEYRGKNKPTDVLSFSYIEENNSFQNGGFPQEDLIGEIAISIDTAKKQAKEHHKTLNKELQFLFVHGLLHVFGYDHEEEEERREMFDLQDEIVGDKSWRKIIE